MSPLLLVVLLAAPLDALEALATSARAEPISGPPPGQTLSRKGEDAVVLAHFKARAATMAEAERIAAPLITGGDPEIVAEARLILGEMHADLASAILESHIPSYLTEDQVELYRMALVDKAYSEQQKAKTAALEVLHAQPSPPLDAWRLWLRVDTRLVDARDMVCRAPAPPWEGDSERRKGAKELMVRLTADLEHLRADLTAWSACLPEDVVLHTKLTVEMAEPVIAENDLSMAPDLMPFIEQATQEVHDALPGACGVTDHTGAPHASPSRSTPPLPSRSTPPLPEARPPFADRAAFDAALRLAIQDPAQAPQPPCPWPQARAPSALQVGALKAVQDAAGTDPASRAALARAWTDASQALVRGLGAPELVHGASTGPAALEAAVWAAAQADQQWAAILHDPASSEGERAEATAALEALTRWRLVIHGLALPPTDCERRRYAY